MTDFQLRSIMKMVDTMLESDDIDKAKKVIRELAEGKPKKGNGG